jgi:hypothetical protein
MHVPAKDFTRRAGKALSERQKHLRQRANGMFTRVRRRRSRS